LDEWLRSQRLRHRSLDLLRCWARSLLSLRRRQLLRELGWDRMESGRLGALRRRWAESLRSGRQRLLLKERGWGLEESGRLGPWWWRHWAESLLSVRRRQLLRDRGGGRMESGRLRPWGRSWAESLLSVRRRQLLRELSWGRRGRGGLGEEGQQPGWLRWRLRRLGLWVPVLVCPVLGVGPVLGLVGAWDVDGHGLSAEWREIADAFELDASLLQLVAEGARGGVVGLRADVAEEDHRLAAEARPPSLLLPDVVEENLGD
jgi:hypothetical protein